MKKKIILIFISLFFINIYGINTYAQNSIENRVNNIFKQKDKQFNLIYKTPYYICLNQQKYYTRITNIINKALNIPKYYKYKGILDIIKNITEKRENICNLNINFNGKPYIYSYQLNKNFKNINAGEFSIIITKKIDDFLNKYKVNKKVNNVINTGKLQKSKTANFKSNFVNNNKKTQTNSTTTTTTTQTKTIIKNNKKIITTTITTTTIKNGYKTVSTKTITKILPINNNSNTNQNTNSNIKQDYKYNPILHSLINLNDINLSKQTNGYINIQNLQKNISLPTVGKIQAKHGNFTIKVNNNWLSLKGLSRLTVDKQYLDYGLKQADKYHPDFKFYYLNGNKYIIYLIKKDKIKSLYPFDPTKDFDYNASKLSKAGYLYFSNFLYKKTNKTTGHNIITAGISKIGNKLYYIVLSGKGSYIPLLGQNMLENINGIKKGSILINNGNNFISAWTNGVKYYYIGTYNLYKNINLKDLGDILYSTFYRIGKYNLPYNVSYMYQLLRFAINFNNKHLTNMYKYIAKNIKYSKQINNLLNKRGMTQEKLNLILKNNRQLALNWDLFYSFQNKVGVCQTISDLFSFSSIINGLNANKATGIFKKGGYSHQISTINNSYYDPTSDGAYIRAGYKTLRFYNMNLNEVSKYLQLDK